MCDGSISEFGLNFLREKGIRRRRPRAAFGNAVMAIYAGIHLTRGSRDEKVRERFAAPICIGRCF